MSDELVVEKEESKSKVPKVSKKASPKTAAVLMSFDQFIGDRIVDKYTKAYWQHVYHGIILDRKTWEGKLKDVLDG